MSTACADAVRSHSCARLAGGRAGLKLTAFSFGGTAFSTDSGARQTSARPVSAQPTMDLACGNAVARCRLRALAAHSPLSCARLASAERCQLDHQHRHRRRQGRRRFLHRRQLFSDESVLFSMPLLLPRVAARRRGGSRRRPRQLWRRLCSAATIGRLGRATRAAQAAQATLRGSSTRLYPLSWRCRKVARHRLIFFSTAPAHAACVCAAGKS